MASRSFYASFLSAEQYLNRAVDYAFLNVPVPPIVPTFRLRKYPSGEISGAYFLADSPKRHKLISRFGQVVTEKLTSSSITRIRRAVQCSSSPFCSFITLTFNPSLSVLGDDATVCHSYAKKEFIRFRQALSQRINRQIKCKLKELPESEHSEYIELKKFRYVWVAELQPGTKNIHFHVLTNKYFPVSWLTKIWGQGVNAVDVQKVNDSVHAAAYMVKYITKESDSKNKIPSIIRGNRYYISRQTSQDMRPIMVLSKIDKEAKECKDALSLFREVIESNGGVVIGGGYGIMIPPPTRAVKYRDKKTGTIKSTKAVKSVIHDAVICDFFPTPF